MTQFNFPSLMSFPPTEELSSSFFDPHSFSLETISSSTSSSSSSTSSSSSKQLEFRLFRLLPNGFLKHIFSFLPIEETAFKVSLVSVRFFACGNIQTQQRYRREITSLWHKYTSLPTPFGFYLVNFAPRLLRFIVLRNPIGTMQTVDRINPPKRKKTQSLSWFFQNSDWQHKEEVSRKRGVTYKDFWSSRHNPIFYIEDIHQNDDNKFIINEIYNHSINEYSKLLGMQVFPSVAFYDELRFGGNWKSIDLGKYCMDWSQVLKIHFPYLEVFKFAGLLNLYIERKEQLLENMPNLTTVIDKNNWYYSDSISAFSSHPRLTKIKANITDSQALANFPKGKLYPNINLEFLIHSFSKPEHCNFKGHRIESLHLRLDPGLGNPSVGLEHFVGIDDITSLYIENLTNQALALLKRFKKLEKLCLAGSHLQINDFTPFEHLPITHLALWGHYKWTFLTEKMFPKLRVLHIRNVLDTDLLNADISFLTILLKTHRIQDFHLFVFSNRRDETIDLNAPWRWIHCENPAEELLNHFSVLNDGSRWMKVTYMCNKEYFAETNTSKVR